MTQLLSFAIFASLVTFIMTGIYKLVVAPYASPTVCRVSLLGIVILPLVAFPVVMCESPEPARLVMTSVQGSAVMLPSDMPPSGPEHMSAAFDYSRMYIPYIAGVCAVMFMWMLSFVRLSVLLRGGRCHRLGKVRMVINSSRAMAPLSWCRYILITPDDLCDLRLIVSHELQHLRQAHWADLLIVQFMIALQWFNPAIWILRSELRRVHEFQADSGVLAAGIDARDYQFLLMKKAVGPRFQSLANSLNHSKLKKRITMMNNQKKQKWGAIASVAALTPAAALALAVCTAPAVRGAIRSASLHQETDGAADSKVTTILPIKSDSTLVLVENTDSEPRSLEFSTVNGRVNSVSVNGQQTSLDEFDESAVSVTIVTPDTVVAPVNSLKKIIFRLDGVEIDDIGVISPDLIASMSINRDVDPPVVDVYTHKSPQFSYESLNNSDGTNIRLSFTGGEGLKITGASFTTCGETYGFKNVNVDFDSESTGRVDLKFKKVTKFKDCSVTINTNRGAFRVKLLN